jgi:hypothetical protein
MSEKRLKLCFPDFKFFNISRNVVLSYCLEICSQQTPIKYTYCHEPKKLHIKHKGLDGKFTSIDHSARLRKMLEKENELITGIKILARL